jgi:hypothetical protein
MHCQFFQLMLNVIYVYLGVNSIQCFITEKFTNNGNLKFVFVSGCKKRGFTCMDVRGVWKGEGSFSKTGQSGLLESKC